MQYREEQQLIQFSFICNVLFSSSLPSPHSHSLFIHRFFPSREQCSGEDLPPQALFQYPRGTRDLDPYALWYSGSRSQCLLVLGIPIPLYPHPRLP